MQDRLEANHTFMHLYSLYKNKYTSYFGGTPLLLAEKHKLNDITLGIISTLKKDNPAWFKEYVDNKNLKGISAFHHLGKGPL